MIKEEKPIFFRVFLVIFMIFLMSLGIWGYNLGIRFNFSNGLIGNSIKDVVVNAKENLTPLSKILIIAQWFLLFLALFFVYFKDKGIKRRNNELIGIDFEAIKKKSTTDIDSLYEILKQRKKIGMGTISTRFKISRELAMEWSRILEMSNLAMIDYPGFGEAVLTLKETKLKTSDSCDKKDTKKPEGFNDKNKLNKKEEKEVDEEEKQKREKEHKEKRKKPEERKEVRKTRPQKSKKKSRK